MQLVVAPGGAVRCLYDEAIDLAALGQLEITRASHVEPDARGRWTADLISGAAPSCTRANVFRWNRRRLSTS